MSLTVYYHELLYTTSYNGIIVLSHGSGYSTVLGWKWILTLNTLIYSCLPNNHSCSQSVRPFLLSSFGTVFSQALLLGYRLSCHGPRC